MITREFNCLPAQFNFVFLQCKWSVVQFIEISEAGGEISTVPTSWIFEEDGLYFSWWPKNYVRHSIKKASAPSENWSKHPVLILSQTG